MRKNIWNKLVTSVAGGAIIIGASAVVSKILGLVRNRLLASEFGAGETLDAYFAAFRLPDLIFNVLVLGALSAAFIPVFIQYWKRAERKDITTQQAWSIVSGMLTIIAAVLVALGGVLAIFAGRLMPLVTPGFDAETLRLTVTMTRIMLISIVFFGVSNVYSGVLNAFRRFVAYAIAPILYNIGILFGIAVFVPLMGPVGLAWGVVLGALLHMLTQLPAVRRTGFRYSFTFAWANTGVRRIFRLMAPRMIGLAAYQFNQLIIVTIASTLAAGSIAVFTLGFDIVSVPINVFGISLAVAAFPVFSKAAAEKDTAKFVGHFSVNFRRILFLILPTSVLFLMLRAQLVRVLYGTGAFGWEETFLTSQAVAFFSLSLFAQALIPMLARSFYAFQDTKTPVVIGIGTMVVNVALGVFFASAFGILGLVFAFSVAAILQMLALLVLLRMRLGDLDDARLLASTLKIVIASTGMGLAIWAMKWFVAEGVNMETFLGVFLQGAVAGTAGIVFYLIFALLLRAEEMQLVAQWLKRLRRFFTNGRRTV